VVDIAASRRQAQFDLNRHGPAVVPLKNQVDLVGAAFGPLVTHPGASHLGVNPNSLPSR
jgi:hypothetical protein